MNIPPTENQSATTTVSTAVVEAEEIKKNLAAVTDNNDDASDSTAVSSVLGKLSAPNASGVINASAAPKAPDTPNALDLSVASNSSNSGIITNGISIAESPSEPMVVAAPLSSVPPVEPVVSVELTAPVESNALATLPFSAPAPPPATLPVLPTISTSSVTIEENVKEPQLSDYLNYRDFLRAFYLYKRDITKTHHRRYNYSFFSAAADIRSPNYLRLIIEGQRNLSEEMAFKFARAMQLNKEGTDEFVLMVLYGQETDPMLRNQYLKTLSDFRLQKSLKLGVIDKKVMEKVPNWIGWILFALLDQEGARFTSSALKNLLRNKASETEIQSALNKLLESGELVQDAATGEIKKGRPQVEAGDDIPSDLIRRLQTQLMSLGLESLFQDSPLDREFGTLTLSLNKKEFEELRFQLRKFRKQIHKDNSIQRMQAKGERVYQLNLQLYPVTDRSKTIAELENN